MTPILEVVLDIYIQYYLKYRCHYLETLNTYISIEHNILKIEYFDSFTSYIYRFMSCNTFSMFSETPKCPKISMSRYTLLSLKCDSDLSS